MPLADFIRHVHSGLGLVNPIVHISYGANDAADTTALRRASLWLTPNVVSDFDPNDFVSLTAAERVALAAAVGQFRRAAERVPDPGPATPEQYREGLAALGEVVRLLDEYLFDPEGRAVYEALWYTIRTDEYGLRDRVIGFDYRLQPDAGGDPAVVIWLTVADSEDVTTRDFQSLLRRTQQAVQEVFADRGIRRWPYVSVRTVGEVQALNAAPVGVA